MYREPYRPDFLDTRNLDFLLKEPSRLSSWLVVSLASLLFGFISYLIYTNANFQTRETVSIERSLRVLNPDLSRFEVSSTNTGTPTSLGSSAITTIPQSRATNTLLGGYGPALLPLGRGTIASSLKAF